jgi:putative phage-type endonuclease
MPTPPIGLRGNAIAPPPTSKRARARWLAARKAGLGASEVAAILGLAPASWGVTPLSIWLDKTNPEVIDGEPTERMQWGLLLEKPILTEFTRRHAKALGIKVTGSPGLLAHEDHPWLMATPDGVGVSVLTAEPECTLEVKSNNHFALREEWAEGVPLNYQVQKQVQLAVTGLSYGYVIPLFGGNHMPEPFVVEADPVAQGQIIEAAGDWWQRHVVERVMPEPVVADSSRLDEVWPGDDSTVRVDPSLEQTLREAAWKHAEAIRLEAEYAEAVLAAKVAMGDAKVAMSTDGVKLATWSRFPKRQTDTAKMLEDHPEVASIIAEYTKPAPSQRFTVAKTVAVDPHDPTTEE